MESELEAEMEEEADAEAESPRLAMSTHTWRGGPIGETGLGNKRMTRCLVMRTTLFCSHLNEDVG